MWWSKKQANPQLSIACCLSENGYSIAVVKNNSHVLFSQNRVFNEKTSDQMVAALTAEVERLNLLAHACQLILLPGQYQLILMDALNVPETDMAKALRWSLKGLSDYDLDDVAMDVFLLPKTDEIDQQKAMVALTPLSVLHKKNAVLESTFLKVTAVGIADVALKNVLTFIQASKSEPEEAPLLVISIYNTFRKLYIMHDDAYYLIRELTSGQYPNADKPPEMANILVEIEHSIDYCVNKLNLPEPKRLLFTPGFHRAISFFKQIEDQFNLTVGIIDLNACLKREPAFSLEEQEEVFYCVAGAIQPSLNEKAT